jgi:hypothetical protein
LLGVDPRCAGLVLDDFGECLARDVDTAVEAVARCFPGGDTALQNRDIPIAEPTYALGYQGEMAYTV